MTIIAIDSLRGAGVDEIMVGVERQPGVEEIPGVIKLLRAYYAPRQVEIVKGLHFNNDPFLEMSFWIDKHLKASMDTETKSLSGLAARAHMYNHFVRANSSTIFIIRDQLFSNVAGSRTSYPEILVPTPQGATKLPGYFFANTLNRYSMNHCIPDLIVSYEPSVQALASVTKEHIEKIQLTYNCYAAVQGLVALELGEKFRLAPIKSQLPTLPPLDKAIEIMFNTIIAGVPK